MSPIKGHLLVTEVSLETISIDKAERDRCVRDFFYMKEHAEREHDRFYALESLYSHIFSYGLFYPNFANLTWEDFHNCKSFEGISQTTHQLLTGFCQNLGFKSIGSRGDFNRLSEPRTESGFKNNTQLDLVHDIASWEHWHNEWYRSHQDQIDWSLAINDWMPRPDRIISILKEELKRNLDSKTFDRIADADVPLAFHDKIMRTQGNRIHAYANSIGTALCLANYYKEEPELSSMEQRASESFRKIFSIINSHGKQQFISIDFAHGMFEFLDENGTHLGEYHFDGTFNSPADLSHSFRCINQWRNRQP
jgi:hypothetical protein